MPLGGRVALFAYGLACYGLFLGVFLYAAGFLGNLAVPKAIDSARTDPLWLALAIDLGLLALFALQHSIMARPGFKRWWTRLVPPAAERSTYVLLSSLALGVLMWQWRPIGGEVWDARTPALRGALWTGFGLGWLLVLGATLQINHFDLFGLRQAWLFLRGRAYTRVPFQVPVLYRIVRHPLYVGWIVAFWCTPTMTATHLVFALVATAYILVAIRFEERDLVRAHGAGYLDYRRRVPMLVPVRLGGRRAA